MAKINDDKKAFTITIDKTLYNTLKKEAEDEIRSINTQIIYILTKRYNNNL